MQVSPRLRLRSTSFLLPVAPLLALIVPTIVGAPLLRYVWEFVADHHPREGASFTFTTKNLTRYVPMKLFWLFLFLAYSAEPQSGRIDVFGPFEHLNFRLRELKASYDRIGYRIRIISPLPLRALLS